MVTGLVLAVLVGVGIMAAATGWHETIAQVSKLTSIQILGLLVLSLVNYLLRVIRWHLFAK